MRGPDHHNERLFSYVRPDSRIPADHPLRAIRKLCDAALARLSERFDSLYSNDGRPSIAPEKLLRALLLLLQAFYSVRSQRQSMEQMNYNLLFRWFVGFPVDEPVWVPIVFSHNRDRLLAGDVAGAFMTAVLGLPQVGSLLSSEHFSVDGTQIKAWASMKSFRRRDGGDQDSGPGRNGERNVHGDKHRKPRRRTPMRVCRASLPGTRPRANRGKRLSFPHTRSEVPLPATVASRPCAIGGPRAFDNG